MLFFTFCISCFLSIITHYGRCDNIPVEIAQSEPDLNDFMKIDSFDRNVSFQDEGPERTCETDPCQNGGICIDVENDFKCMCESPYFGKTCNENPCSGNKCKNGGECQVQGNTFRCICKPPFTGYQCERDLCTVNPCENGGKCTIIKDHFNCSCIPPYSGDLCEIGPCYPNPCQNEGECEVDGYNFNCTCQSPFIGDTCEDKLCFPNPCLNNGTCAHDEKNFECSCIFPFYGVTCDKGPCTPNPCLNDGMCVNDGGKFMCLCEYPFHGVKCENGPCTLNPCLNGGICMNDREKYKCICKDSFYGERCEIDICSPNPCLNGGICMKDWKKFICSCARPFHGERCEKKNNCMPNPCLNDGLCFNKGTEFSCMCRRHFYGERCEEVEETTTQNFRTSTLMPTVLTTISRDICHPNPCKNGGECKIIEHEFEGFDKKSYQCFCPEPFSGNNCEIEMETTTQNFRRSTLMTTMLTTISTNCDCGEKSSDCFVDSNGLKTCVCLPGYTQIKEICSDCYCGIQSLSCRFNSTGDKICQCKAGYGQKSRSCIEMCDSDKDCLNGGVCKHFERGFFCECRTHFTGYKCEISTACDELRERCKVIGAVCTQREGRGSCECPPHKMYVMETGFCEDICESTKCFHGKCEIVGKSYRCRCDEGFSGSRCDEKIIVNMRISWFLIFFLIFCNIIVTIVIGIFFCACRNRRSKNKETVQ